MEAVFKPQTGKQFLFGVLRGYGIWIVTFIISLFMFARDTNIGLLALVTFGTGMVAGLIWQAITNAGKGIVVSNGKVSYKRFGKEKEILSGNISVSPVTNVRYGRKDMPVKIQGLNLSNGNTNKTISCNFLNSEDFKKVCNILGCTPSNTNKNNVIKDTDGMVIDERRIKKQVIYRKIFISCIVIAALVALLLAFVLPLAYIGATNSLILSTVLVWAAIAVVSMIVMFTINKRAEITSACIPSNISLEEKQICIDKTNISLEDIQNIVMNEPKQNAILNGFRFMKIQCYNERKVYCFGRYKRNGIKKEICPEYNTLYEELKKNLPDKFISACKN